MLPATGVYNRGGRISGHYRSKPVNRRGFLAKAARCTGALAAADFFSYSASGGLGSLSPALTSAVSEHAKEASRPRFLIYWFMEGAWMSYDMFGPVVPVRNDASFGDLPRDPNDWGVISEHLYRTKDLAPEDFRRHGEVFHGPLAEDGRELFGEMAILSSALTGSGHTRDRFKAHYGQYTVDMKARREPDERTVLQAFCERAGRSYLMPNLNWHRWLSDGELDISAYPEGTGIYHALGPPWAHIIYPQTPKFTRNLIRQTLAMRNDERNHAVQGFLEQSRRSLLSDRNSPELQSFASALDVYKRLVQGGGGNTNAAPQFLGPELREEFGVTPDDEEIHFELINQTLPRSKYTPNINVQAMMMYEMLTSGLSCSGWLENRLVRGFDHHWSRSKILSGYPFDQREMMRRELWTPLKTFVRKLKETEYLDTGNSFYDYTTIVLSSEFGRTVGGSIETILANSDLSEEEKREQILSQDISAHNPVNSCAFLGPRVRGGAQFGWVGQKTFQPIPIHPVTGDLDPRYDRDGNLRKGYDGPTDGFITPNHGHIYSTALKLAGVDPKGAGRNESPHLPFILASGA